MIPFPKWALSFFYEELWELDRFHREPRAYAIRLKELQRKVGIVGFVRAVRALHRHGSI